MSKFSNKDAFYERMRDLAKVNESKVPEKSTLGDLISYKRGADKVAYGIVKENHHYYIKKSNKQDNPLVEDFTYIGGLSNIKEYQYGKSSEADKSRNLLLITINEALGGKGTVIPETKKAGKRFLSESKKSEKEEEAAEEKEEGKKHEDKESAEFEKGEKEEEKEEAKEEDKEKVDEGAEEELDAAEQKLDATEIATDEVPAPTPEPELDVNALDLPPENTEVPAEMPAVDGGAEMPVDGGEEMPMDGGAEMPVDGGEEMPVDGGEEMPMDGGEEMPAVDGGEEGDPDENNREIQKMVGKIGNLARTTEMTPSQVQGYVNSVLSAFEDKFPELEVEERKEMADKITNVIDGEADLENSDVDIQEERVCNECGFAKFADSMGYEDGDTLMDSDDEEKATLMSNYMMECDGAVPDEDLATMAMISNDKVVESLVNEYGHSGLAESLEPFTKELNEVEDTDKKGSADGMYWWKIEPQKEKNAELKVLSEEDKETFGGMSDDELGELEDELLNELNLAGLKNVGSYLKGKAGEKIAGAGRAIKNKAGQVSGAIIGAFSDKIDQATQSFEQLGNDISQVYNKEVKADLMQKMEQMATEFGLLINKLDVASQKAGDGPINKIKLTKSLQSALRGDTQMSMKMKEGFGMTDHASTQVDPQLASDEMEVNENGDESGVEGEESAFEMNPGFDTMGAAVVKPDGAPTTSIDIEQGSVKVTMSESEQKLRKYIRTRLEEMSGKRKPSLMENKKSEKIKNLDKLIEDQFNLFESILDGKTK